MILMMMTHYDDILMMTTMTHNDVICYYEYSFTIVDIFISLFEGGWKGDIV